jgi:iron complex outermembrane receptor protein
MHASTSFAGSVVASPLLCFSLLGAAAAEESGGGQREGSEEAAILEDVIVTARRREERLQDVPVSASTFSTDQLERRQILNLNMLQYAAPNLTNAPNRTSGASASLAMRGQVELETTPTLDPAVGLYLDGVYIARTVGANLDLIDMERVEVLRGPQGTLFGRNTTGGAINLIPRRPIFDREGLLQASVGNYDRVELTAILNVPLARDRAALRLATSHLERSGYGRNALLGLDLDDDDTDFVRAQLSIAPGDRWDLNLSFDYSGVSTGPQLLTLLDVSPESIGIPVMLGDPAGSLTDYVDPAARTIWADRAGPVETSVWGVSGELTMDFGRFTLKSTTAYRDLQAGAFDSDQDGTPYDLGVILYRGDDQHQVSQEFQLYGAALNDRLDWIGGVHYFRESATYTQHFRMFLPRAFRWDVGMPSGDANNKSIAGYAQLTYAIVPQLRITAGARFNQDERQLTSRNGQRIGDVEICRLDPSLRDERTICRVTLPERTFSYVPWTLGVDYTTPDGAMLYAKVSRGHRAGGYNIRGATLVDLDTFEPEHVTAYEVGAKTELFNRRLRVNLALFRSQFEDIQLTQRESDALGVRGVRFTENGGEARIDGGELEMTALLGPLRLAGHYGTTRPTFTKLDPRVDGISLDSRFPQTPDWTTSLAADLPFATGLGEVNVHGDYSWRDDVAYTYDPDSLARQCAYGLLNAMISIRFARTDLELSLWGRNLTDRDYIARAFDTDFYISATPGDPRTYGLSLTYRSDSR